MSKNGQQFAWLTEKGNMMSRSFKEYLFMNYMLPEKNQRKKWTSLKNEFMNDMQFSLKTGEVLKH